MRRQQISAVTGNQVAYDEHAYWTSFYRAQVRGTPTDWMTIGAGTDPEARFHYNASENSIIRALLRLEPATGVTAQVWRFAQRRRDLRVLDIGSGTGHWIDFFREVFFAGAVIGVEITEQMAGHLQAKYRDEESVSILRANIADDRFVVPGGPVDLVSAIGVMFHIVDDAQWRRAIANLHAALMPGGLMLVGGDFGVETRNVQFHAADNFDSWSEQIPAPGSDTRVNKRVRSLAEWHRAVTESGFSMIDLLRSDFEPGIATPENDLLVLRRPA
ncbi:MAG: class I SAM-dependent methyltransferase [Dongiaceae bacterium]